MEDKKKSVSRPAYNVVLGELRKVRVEAGLSQLQLAALLDRPQTFVSAAEVGKKRLDLLQVQDWARCCRIDLPTIAQRIFDKLPRKLKRRSKKVS